MAVLDLGCGAGRDLNAWGVTASDKIVGIDIDKASLAIAQTRFGERAYFQARAECLPFKNDSFDRVIAGVSLPYTNIPQALREAHRILAPGGCLSLTFHPPSFTVEELLHDALPKAFPTMFRLYVLANGIAFHFSGKTFRFFNGRTESFQTERGMRIALARAQFTDFSFRNGIGPIGKTFIVEAKKRASGDAPRPTHAGSLILDQSI
jgi:ubiquinone/menaquinone biosynthesis C-methylase UbiE